MNLKKYAIVDIHFHLDGSLSPEMVIEVAKEENIELPTYDSKELRKYLEVPEKCESLNDYLTRFDLPNLVLQTVNGIYKNTLDVLKRLSNQGIKYVEIRMAPQLSTAKGLTQSQVVKAMIDAKKEAEKLFNIKSNFILCMMRGTNNVEANIETINVAKEYLGKGVVAIDLAGAEALFKNDLFAQQFALAKSLNIPFTIHAGEAAGSESVKKAIEFGASRIGHGIHSIEDKDVVNALATKKIPLEICPKSNLDTKTISKFSDLPLREFRKAGVKVSINTDDSTVSNTTLENEYKILSSLGFTEEELKQYALDSIDSCFISEKEKDELRKFIL